MNFSPDFDFVPPRRLRLLGSCASAFLVTLLAGCFDNGALLGQATGGGNAGGATNAGGHATAQGGASIAAGGASIAQGGASLSQGGALGEGGATLSQGGAISASGGAGGATEVTLCNGNVCGSDQFCCGPSECGFCAYTLQGPNCPTACPPATVDCNGSLPVSFPIFDRNCSTDADCTMVNHQTDCCGNVLVTGIAKRAQNDFQTAEQTCESELLHCGCGLPVTTADTGKTVTTTAFVTCLAGTCTTDAQ